MGTDLSLYLEKINNYEMVEYCIDSLSHPALMKFIILTWKAIPEEKWSTISNESQLMNEYRQEFRESDPVFFSRFYHLRHFKNKRKIGKIIKRMGYIYVDHPIPIFMYDKHINMYHSVYAHYSELLDRGTRDLMNAFRNIKS